MKHWTLILMVLFTMAGCQFGGNDHLDTSVVNNPATAGQGTAKAAGPQITFDNTEHDFGRMIQGERVVYRFNFTNTGDADLLISKVNSSCGCTVGKYPHEVITPGQKGEIEVSFDSSGRKGFQHKTVTVLSNSRPNTTTLRIKAEVVLPEKH